MNLRTLRTKILGAAVMLTLSQAAWAGKLDVDYLQTSPTKTLVYAVAFPGGGYYYLSKIDPKYRKKLYFFLAMGIVSGAFLAVELKNKNTSMQIPAFLVAGGIELWGFGSATDDAESERLKWLRKNFKTNDADTAPVSAPAK